MKSPWGRAGSWLLLAALAAPGQAETRRVIAGRESYDVSGLHELWFGEGRRELWTTPFETEVLDLRSFAGGLTPVRQVGSMQSIGLALKGADGKAYTFRKHDKDPTRILPPEWRDSLPALLFQDQTAASHPGASLIVPPLAQAAGIPHTTARFVFMPDDPALGEFREAFGGQAGAIDEYPLPAREGSAGFMGATEIIDTPKLWERWLAGQGRVDTEALLRARLFDLFIGDWDRHNGQWRWMKVPGQDAWQPLPEDRDGAFANYSGLALSMARATVPRLVHWRDDFDNLPGLALQGREVDAWLLVTLSQASFAEAARDLQGRLTDPVIEDAVHQMPPEWYARGGDQLVRDLKARRELLPAAAVALHSRLARWVDVQGTDRDDVARLTREADGSAVLELALAGPGGEPGPPYFSRRFARGETREVRVYLYGGDDRFVATGPAGGVTVRVAGGPGADRLDDSASGGTRFYDVDGGGEVARGAGTSVSSLRWTRQPYKRETLWLEKRDFGTFTLRQPLVWWEPDPGVVVRLGLTHYRYGFRKQPYASAHTGAVEWKSGREAFKLSYTGDFRWARPGFGNVLELWSDGARNYNFYGFGNQTGSGAPSRTYEADQQVSYVFPSLVSYETPRRRFGFSVGPELKYSRNKAAADTLLAQDQPYGFGDFGQVGARLKIRADTRGRKVVAPGAAFRDTATRSETGVRLELDGTYYAAAWDVRSAFGAVEGFGAAYWQPTRRVILAGRAGGRSLWGDYPWGEAAFLGGKDSLRGYAKNRFAGDSSLYAGAELRLELGRLGLLLPMRVGVFGLADAGRVWLEGESSGKWHKAWGGGLFLRLMTLDSTVYAAVAQGDEDTRVYVDYGFSF